MKTYNPQSIVLTVGGVHVQGFAPGTMVKITQGADRVKKKVGATGEAVLSMSCDRSATCEATLMQTSTAHELLDALLVLQDQAVDQGGAPAALAFQLKDAVSGEVHSGSCLISKAPEDEYADEAGQRVWSFEIDRLTSSRRGMEA